MRNLPNTSELTDKERIFLLIIQRMRAFPQTLIALKDPPEMGTLVMAASAGIHPFTIGFFAGSVDGAWAIKGIGSKKTCRIHNDYFYEVTGMLPEEILVGKQYKTFRYARIALQSLPDNYRYGDFCFEGKSLIITIREKWDGFVEGDRFTNETFEIRFPIGKPIKHYRLMLANDKIKDRPFRVWDKEQNCFISKERYIEIKKLIANTKALPLFHS